MALLNRNEYIDHILKFCLETKNKWAAWDIVLPTLLRAALKEIMPISYGHDRGASRFIFYVKDQLTLFFSKLNDQDKNYFINHILLRNIARFKDGDEKTLLKNIYISLCTQREKEFREEMQPERQVEFSKLKLSL
jgi:hypothetical protein